ncbi:MAG: histidine phosphatase family protein, partial [Pseudomonadota bacterium]|nr:histidine phosphatase family protein [Pseudomonadota bacterium]
GWPDAGDAILIVGHQPALGEAAARAAGEIGSGGSFKKGAVRWLQSAHGEGGARVHATQSADEL